MVLAYGIDEYAAGVCDAIREHGQYEDVQYRTGHDIVLTDPHFQKPGPE